MSAIPSATSTNPSLDLESYLSQMSTGKSGSKSSTGTTGSSKGASSTLDKNQFMQLMVTQLKYQDPLNPSDNQQMAAQMAQFSSLESMQNIQTSMEKLNTTMTDASSKQVSASEAVATTSATSLLGNTVRLRRAGVEYAGAKLDISVHGSAGSELAIVDAKGNTVRTLALKGTSADGKTLLDANGEGVLTWDGTGDDGKAVPAGSYTVSVKDAAGNDAGYAFDETSVTGIGSDATGTILQTKNGDYHLSDLIQISESGRVGTTSAAGTADNSAATSAAVALIGRTVRIKDPTVVLAADSADKTGATKLATVAFTATKGAKGQILDAKGNLVRTFDMAGYNPDGSKILATDGTGKFQWTGDSDDGTPVPKGTYYAQIVTKDGTASAGVVYATRKVDQIGFDASGSPILVNGSDTWSYKNLYTVS